MYFFNFFLKLFGIKYFFEWGICGVGKYMYIYYMVIYMKVEKDILFYFDKNLYYMYIFRWYFLESLMWWCNFLICVYSWIRNEIYDCLEWIIL